MRILLLILAICLTLTTASWACPFCSPTSSDIYTVAKNSKAVCKVQRLGGGKFKILQVLRGTAKVGKVVLAGDPESKLSQGPRLLVLSTISNPSQPYWSEPVRSLTKEEYLFLKALLEAKSEAGRQDLAAKNLLCGFRLSEDAAYNILALAPLQAVQKRRGLVGRKALIQAVNNPDRLTERKSLYLLMLLPEVTGADKAWLRDLIFRPRLNPMKAHLPALMAAYAKAGGETAIKEMAQALLHERTTVSESFNATSGFTFIGTESKDTSTREAARAVIRAELSSPERGVFVIPPLAKWGDYSVASQVEKLAYCNTDTPWVVGSVVRYFRSFQNSAAKKALERLQREYPDIVEAYSRPY